MRLLSQCVHKHPVCPANSLTKLDLFHQNSNAPSLQSRFNGAFLSRVLLMCKRECKHDRTFELDASIPCSTLLRPPRSGLLSIHYRGELCESRNIKSDTSRSHRGGWSHTTRQPSRLCERPQQNIVVLHTEASLIAIINSRSQL